ncbi:MAG: glutaminyl-tRNA synthase (glutamine-hydrolyzing) subunit A [Chloroflexi bacterium 44-23]|nr:MAG: glutaminyl-tRNA synthase (glutamine-hydrolyzing) subunit A [Chloroflexi bacterium 44-23]
MQLCDTPAHELSILLRKKKISAKEIVESCLERVAAVDGRPGSLDPGENSSQDNQSVHAMITLTAEKALAQAKGLDDKVARGEPLGSLAGVPFTVKDIFCVKDTLTTAASRMLANFRAPYTATTVERMLAQDGLMIGKVNLDEYTFGSSNESTAFQPAPRNPWDTNRVPGGSSGGSAASVAAGEAAISLGTDTAGSIRQPAAFCGVVGIKPTYGRVSRYGLIAFASSLDCPGPLARNVTDAAMLLKAIAGPDRQDATAVTKAVPDYVGVLDQGVKGLRIGLSEDYFKIVYMDAETGEMLQKPVPDEVRAAVYHAAEILKAQGAEIIEDVPMPNTRYAIPAFFVISRVEAASNLHRFDGAKYGYRTAQPKRDLREMYQATRNEAFGLQPKLRILMGMYVSAAQYSEQYYSRALKVRTLIRRDFENVFDPGSSYHLDALLTPTTPTTAFEMGAVYGDSVLMQYADQFTVTANHAGIPGMTFPAGLGADGLPLGVQLLGPDFSEPILLRMGRVFEEGTQAEAWRLQKPQVLRGLA